MIDGLLITFVAIWIMRAFILWLLHWDCYIDFYNFKDDVHSERCRLENQREEAAHGIYFRNAKEGGGAAICQAKKAQDMPAGAEVALSRCKSGKEQN